MYKPWHMLWLIGFHVHNDVLANFVFLAVDSITRFDDRPRESNVDFANSTGKTLIERVCRATNKVSGTHSWPNVIGSVSPVSSLGSVLVGNFTKGIKKQWRSVPQIPFLQNNIQCLETGQTSTYKGGRAAKYAPMVNSVRRPCNKCRKDWAWWVQILHQILAYISCENPSEHHSKTAHQRFW